jgi:two-component system, NtrC family, sensor kinase
MEKLIRKKSFIQFCEALPTPVVLFGADRAAFKANDQFCRIMGMGKETLIHRKCYEIFMDFQEPCPELNCPLNILLAEKRTVSRVYKKKRPDGTTLYLDLFFSCVLNGDGEVDYIITTARDITQSKEVKADLKKTTDFLERIIESSVNAIVVADMKGKILFMNQSARELFNSDANGEGGMGFARDYYFPGVASNIMEKLRSLEYGGMGKLDGMRIELRTGSGEEIPVEMTASIIYERGEEVATMAIFKDLRPQIAAEERLEEAREQLMQSEKLVSIGQLAAGVAHEINNPLGGILMYSHLVLEDLPEKSPARENLQKVIEQAERCKKIVKGLLDFSRQRKPEITSVQLNELIDETFRLVESQSVFQNIKIEKKLDPSLPSIAGDRSQLQQVLLNLILNAAGAMARGGILSVSSSCEGDGVEIRCRDTGCGISAENMEKIFEPFFTTKSEKDGTGLGLSISLGIVKNHGGALTVDSQPGRGTTFTVRLPAVKNEGPAPRLRE